MIKKTTETAKLICHDVSDLIEIEKQNPFLTSKVKRKTNSRDCRILFLYPNERGMSTIPPNESRVVSYDPEAVWDGTNYFGASLLVLQNLGLKKGYTLVRCDNNGVNAFFCKSELISDFEIKDIQDLYRPPKYGEIINNIHIGHPLNTKKVPEL